MKPYIFLSGLKDDEGHYRVHLREDRSVELGSVGEDQKGWLAFHPDKFDYTFYGSRGEAAKALYDYYLRQTSDHHPEPAKSRFTLEFTVHSSAIPDAETEVSRILRSVAAVMDFQTVHGRTSGEIYDLNSRVIGLWAYASA